MKSILALAAATLLVTGTARAEDRHHRHHHRHHHHGGAPGWVYPGIALGVLGGVAIMQYESCMSYDTVFVGYDAWGRPVYRRVCY